jgi:hypothetical protein
VVVWVLVFFAVTTVAGGDTLALRFLVTDIDVSLAVGVIVGRVSVGTVLGEWFLVIVRKDSGDAAYRRYWLIYILI